MKFATVSPGASGPSFNEGAGVVVLETGKIFGGDSGYYYLGSYAAGKNGLLTAKVMITHYAGSQQSVLGPGVKQGTLALAEEPPHIGRTDPDGNRQIVLFGDVPGRPGEKFVCELTWRARLPG